MRRFAVPFALALTAALAACTSGPQRPASVSQAPALQGPPRLIVAISVDQFSADLYAQYRPRFAAGLARLAGGAVSLRAFRPTPPPKPAPAIPPC